MKYIQAFFSCIGRFAIAAVFVSAGINKILGWDATLQYMTSAGLTQHTEYLLLGAIAVELIGGLSFAFGCMPKLAATALALFLIPTTYTFHNFWTLTDPVAIQAQQIEFFKNLAIFGGLLCYIASPSTASKPAKSEK